jgi:single-strand DNA-binding protein
MPDNSVTLVGNLTRSAELRFTSGGTATASFGIAVNNRRKNSAGEYEDDPKFFNITAFGTLAENASASLEKGMRVIVVGRLDFQQWETPEGDKRSKVEVIADSIGPDLRWAIAGVERNEKKSGGGTSVGGARSGAPAREEETF